MNPNVIQCICGGSYKVKNVLLHKKTHIHQEYRLNLLRDFIYWL